MPTQQARRREKHRRLIANKCAHCRRIGIQPDIVDEEAVPLNRCSGCKCVYYCSANCQTDHWLRHKRFCEPTRTFKQATKHTQNLNQEVGLINLQSRHAYLIGCDPNKRRAYFAIQLGVNPNKNSALVLGFQDLNTHYVASKFKGSSQLCGEIRLDNDDFDDCVLGQNVTVEYGIQQDYSKLAILFVELPPYALNENKVPQFTTKDPVKLTFVLSTIDPDCLNNVTIVYKGTVPHENAQFLYYKYQRPSNQLNHTKYGWIWQGGAGEYYKLNTIDDENWVIPSEAQLWKPIVVESEEEENEENEDVNDENNAGEQSENGKNKQETQPKSEEKGHENEGERDSELQTTFSGGVLDIQPFTRIKLGEEVPPENEGHRIARIGDEHIVVPISPEWCYIYFMEDEKWYTVVFRSVDEALKPGQDSLLYADGSFYVHRQFELCRCQIFRMQFNQEKYGLFPVANIDIAAQMFVTDYTPEDPQVVAVAPGTTGNGGGGLLVLPISPRDTLLQQHMDVKFAALKI